MRLQSDGGHVDHECGERFVITNSSGYLAKFPPSPLRRACNVVWVIGTALIILNWIGIVPPLVGWIGFGVAGIGWIVAATLKR